MTKNLILATALAVTTPAFAAAGHAASGTTPNVSCHAALTLADARALAAATPNARAFVDNYGATLETEVHAQAPGAAYIAVTASDPKHGTAQVGIYTVSLRTGHVTDDDMEPAEDAGTAAVRTKLMERHCTAK